MRSRGMDDLTRPALSSDALIEEMAQPPEGQRVATGDDHFAVAPSTSR